MGEGSRRDARGRTGDQARGARSLDRFEDTGRAEITGKASDNYKFRSLTLRQLKDARTFFHNGSFTNVRDAVSYFNAGVAQDPTAGAAETLDARFTNPRGAGTQRENTAATRLHAPSTSRAMDELSLAIRFLDIGTELTLVHAELCNDVSARIRADRHQGAASSHEGGWAGALVKLNRAGYGRR